MRKIITVLFIAFACFSKGFAQEDSTKVGALQQQQFFADSIGMAHFNFVKQTPLFISQYNTQVSRITVGHQLEKGGLIPVQGSTKTNSLFLTTEGTAKLKNVSLYGSFLYRKSFEDSTRFAHQSRNNPSTPYYFGSPARNHYERTSYQFDAVAGKDFLSDKLTVGVGIDYLVADHFATNDPRGAIKEYQFNSNLQVGINLSKNLQVGAGLSMGYGREDFNIGYKNRLYYQSTYYPEYVNYLINGYREPGPETENRQYSDLLDRFGANLMIKTNGKLGFLLAKASLIRETQNYEYRASNEISTLSTYTINKLTADLLWFKEFRKNERLSLAIAYIGWDGEDLNVEHAAKNYVYTKTDASVKANYFREIQNISYQYGIEGRIFGEERLDGLSANEVYYQNLMLTSSFGVQYRVNSKKSYGASIGAHYLTNLRETFKANELAASGNSNFTRIVIFHDYLYHTATRFGGSLHLDHSFPLLKNMQGAVRLGAVYNVKDQLKSLSRAPLSIPGEDRLFTDISFNIYF